MLWRIDRSVYEAFGYVATSVLVLGGTLALLTFAERRALYASVYLVTLCGCALTVSLSYVVYRGTHSGNRAALVAALAWCAWALQDTLFGLARHTSLSRNDHHALMLRERLSQNETALVYAHMESEHASSQHVAPFAWYEWFAYVWLAALAVTASIQYTRYERSVRDVVVRRLAPTHARDASETRARHRRYRATMSCLSSFSPDAQTRIGITLLFATYLFVATLVIGANAAASAGGDPHSLVWRTFLYATLTFVLPHLQEKATTQYATTLFFMQTYYVLVPSPVWWCVLVGAAQVAIHVASRRAALDVRDDAPSAPVTVASPVDSPRTPHSRASGESAKPNVSIKRHNEPMRTITRKVVAPPPPQRTAPITVSEYRADEYLNRSSRTPSPPPSSARRTPSPPKRTESPERTHTYSSTCFCESCARRRLELAQLYS